jgi:hypothetical protein
LGGQLSELIALAHKKTGQRAVVLIDEYDKPILDNITNSAVALEMREGLNSLYSVLKAAFTTRLTCCCCFAAASFGATGLRPAHPAF